MVDVQDVQPLAGNSREPAPVVYIKRGGGSQDEKRGGVRTARDHEDDGTGELGVRQAARTLEATF